MTESLFLHVLKLQCWWSQGVSARWLPSRLIAVNVKKEELATQLRSWVATMAQPSLHEVSTKAEDAARFYDYWIETQRKQYGKKTR